MKCWNSYMDESKVKPVLEYKDTCQQSCRCSGWSNLVVKTMLRHGQASPKCLNNAYKFKIDWCCPDYKVLKIYIILCKYNEGRCTSISSRVTSTLHWLETSVKWPISLAIKSSLDGPTRNIPILRALYECNAQEATKHLLRDFCSKVLWLPQTNMRGTTIQ